VRRFLASAAVGRTLEHHVDTEIIVESVRSDEAAAAIAQARCPICGQLEEDHDEEICLHEFENQ